MFGVKYSSLSAHYTVPYMSSSLSNLADNLSEGLHCDKCMDYKFYLDYMSVKDDQQSCTQSIFRCFECKKNYKKDFNKELMKIFANIYVNFVMKTLINLLRY